MILPEWFIRFTKWIEEHPYKTMFFIQLPLCLITTIVSIELLT